MSETSFSDAERLAAVGWAREDLYDFSRWMFLQRKGYHWKRAKHHEIICKALMRVYRGECKRLIINIPPRYSKTELAVVNFIAWCFGKVPDAEFIHTSYSGTLATNNSVAVRGVLQHEAFAEIFPGTVLDSEAKSHWTTTAGGVMYTAGVDGTMTGFGAGKDRAGFGGCFPYEQLVETEIGPVAIGDIVTRKLDVRVWSWNEAKRKVELQPVDTLWINPDNEVIEFGMPDGSSFRCTPNHRLLTSSGWIEAREISDSLNLVNRKPGFFGGLLSRLRSVRGNANRFIRVLWLWFPRSIGQACGNACPGFSHFDLSNNPESNAVTSGKIRRAFIACEDGDNITPVELGSRPASKERECSVADGILHVFGLRAPSKVCESVVSAIPVKVSRLVKWWARSRECFKNKVGDIAQGHFSTNGKINPEISLAVVAGLEQSHRHLPADPAKVRHFIKPGCARYIKPSFVRYAGHVGTTYCLEVRSNHNFILAQCGVIVSNCIIIDDPHKADEARSEVMRQNVIDWFQNTVESRKNDPENTPIILIMQRLHEKDLAGWLLGGGNGEKWEHVCLPALQDDGTALWPEKHGAERLKVMQQAAPYTFAGQYQQKPSPPEGNIFKPDHIEIVDAMPADTRFVRAWDFAASIEEPGKDPDWTVGFKLGITPSGRWVIADVGRLRGGPETVEAALKNTATRDGSGVRVRIPQDPGQAGKSQAANFTKLLAGFTVTAKPVSGDKVQRAEPFAAQVNVGNVMMLRAEWNDALISEMRVFPNGSHDDQVDAGSDAFDELNINNFGMLDYMQQVAQQALEQQAKTNDPTNQNTH